MKKQTFFIALMISMFSTTGSINGECKIEDTVDEFTKTRVIKTVGNEVQDDLLQYSFNLMLFNKPDGETLFGLKGTVEANNWIFINEIGNAVKILADGELFEFRVGPVKRDVIYGKRIRESYSFVLRKEQLYKIATAKVLKIRIYGRNGYIEVDNLSTIQNCWFEYYKKYIQNNPDVR